MRRVLAGGRWARGVGVVLWAGVLSALVGCRGCGAQRTGPRELVVLIEASVENLDPRFAASGYGIKISRLVAAPLVSLNSPNLLPRMELAERVETPDPRTYLVHLRPKARFSDGTPVRATDVKATFESIRSPRSLSPYRAAFKRIAEITVLGPRRVRFRLRRPHAPFISDLDIGILKAAQARRYRERIPDDKLVGAGPLQLVRRTTERIELVPNPHFHGARPALQRYVIKTVEDDNARLVSLLAGGGDLTQNSVAPLLLPALRRSKKLRIQTGPSVMTTYLGLNTSDPRLADRRVRLALALAIDRQRIVKAKFRGRAALAASILAPHHWAFNRELPRRKYDPARARQLLDAAGHRRPAGGWRFALTYKTSSNRFRVAVARVIAQQLRRVGIRVTVRPLEWGVFFSDLKRGNFQIVTLQMTELAEPDYHYYFFHSSMQSSAAKPNAGGNRWGYHDARADALMDRGRREHRRAQRAAIYRELQAILARDLPVVPLWHEENLVVMRRGVRGYQLLPNARFDPLLRVTKTR